MTRTTLALGALLVVAGGAALGAQAPSPDANRLAITHLSTGKAKLVVTSPAFKMMGDIPFKNTQYRGNVFPGLRWEKEPRGTRSYAIIMQDANAMIDGKPILHWTMANIPAGVHQLPAGKATLPRGAANGPNIRGPNQPYMGPHTPPGPAHQYHIQVFALDDVLPESALGSYDAMVDAMQGHVLAAGELVGLGRAPE